MTRSVLILVTHLLGVGHLTRAAALGRGLAAAGHRVTLVTGGRPAPLVATDGMRVVQLPSVQCVGVDFRTLLTADGTPVTDRTRQVRLDCILAALEESQADVVITETYPFGRRQLAGEFEALLQATRARSKPVAVLASIRDILNPPAKAIRADEAEAMLARYYDGVLVHGDAIVTPLSASWPTSPALERILTYTGYIADAADACVGPMPSSDILVSGGGSAASLPLYDVAIAAAANTRLANPWRILVGHGVKEADFAGLAARANERVIVERARPDFPALLAGAAVSISQAGYNTMIDLGRAGVPAIVVPFEQGKEAEQRLRAERFSTLGLATIVSEADLRPSVLARAVETALSQARRQFPPLNLDGVPGSVHAVEQAADQAEALVCAWARLDAALARAKAEGRQVRFWWRDDDAIAPSRELDRLLDLAQKHGVPLALAIIPAPATSALAARLSNEPLVEVLVHGFHHQNHAPADHKKQELGYRPVDSMIAELGKGLSRLQGLFGDRCLPVLVPPWNRIDPALLPSLSMIGFQGLSTFGKREAVRTHGLAVVNTHCDPIDWKKGGGLAEQLHILDCLSACIHLDEPVGILTHHLVHDPWIWSFLDGLLGKLVGQNHLGFQPARELFGMHRHNTKSMTM